MKKKSILNLIKYHAENNESGFRSEAYEIAKGFDKTGDHQLAEYIMALLSSVNTFVPQMNQNDSSFFKKLQPSSSSLPLPKRIKEDVVGIVNAVNHGAGINKFLLEGAPGTGKTETAKQLARILERELYAMDFDQIIDSKLGQTSKNITEVFHEIQSLPRPEKAIILLDEIDAIALDRINSNDLREMGRATSSMLKGLDGLNDKIVLIATTNLYDSFDRALIRRFDSVINFNRYSRDELVEVAESILNELLGKFKSAGRNMKLFKKIILLMNDIPYPGDLRNMIKTALAFSNPGDEFDYLRKLYDVASSSTDLKELKGQGFSVREMEILTGISKSQVSRELKG